MGGIFGRPKVYQPPQEVTEAQEKAEQRAEASEQRERRKSAARRQSRRTGGLRPLMSPERLEGPQTRTTLGPEK